MYTNILCDRYWKTEISSSISHLNFIYRIYSRIVFIYELVKFNSLKTMICVTSAQEICHYAAQSDSYFFFREKTCLTHHPEQDGTPIPTVQELISKANKGTAGEDPEIALQKFTGELSNFLTRVLSHTQGTAYKGLFFTTFNFRQTDKQNTGNIFRSKSCGFHNVLYTNPAMKNTT